MENFEAKFAIQILQARYSIGNINSVFALFDKTVNTLSDESLFGVSSQIGS